MKKRIISAIVMTLIFIPFLILGDTWYSVFVGMLGLVSLWELIRLEKNIPIYMQVLSYIICLLMIIFGYSSIFAMVFFFAYSFGVIITDDLKKYNYKDGLWLFGVTLLVGLIFSAVIKIRSFGLFEMIYCMIIAYATDTFALFGGMLFGKTKLCEEISPHKTVEGSIIGTVFGTALGTVFYTLLIGRLPIWVVISLSLVLSILGQFGDLFFSSIKRQYGIKDFSDVIPGHGGLLDRLDSLLFVVLGYLLCLVILSITII